MYSWQRTFLVELGPTAGPSATHDLLVDLPDNIENLTATVVAEGAALGAGSAAWIQQGVVGTPTAFVPKGLILPFLSDTVLPAPKLEATRVRYDAGSSLWILEPALRNKPIIPLQLGLRLTNTAATAAPVLVSLTGVVIRP